MALTAPVEVIVPVFNAATDLANCLDALFRTVSPSQPVQIIDDASTDGGARQVMARHAGRPGVACHYQERNLGFVATVNAAMARSGTDVVLLNSDTVPTEGWLDRIVECARSDPRIATITPFSNNAEICSFPDFCRNNPPGPDPDRLARTFRRVGNPEYPDLPTAVGFCMFIRRRALNELGLFDEETFGRGYGEENDFCRRAASHGWRNVLCDDAYVVHLGGRSFAETGLKPGGENLRRLLARYPDYNDLVADFIARDPIRPRRERLLAALQSGEDAG